MTNLYTHLYSHLCSDMAVAKKCGWLLGGVSPRGGGGGLVSHWNGILKGTHRLRALIQELGHLKENKEPCSLKLGDKPGNKFR